MSLKAEIGELIEWLSELTTDPADDPSPVEIPKQSWALAARSLGRVARRCDAAARELNTAAATLPPADQLEVLILAEQARAISVDTQSLAYRAKVLRARAPNDGSPTDGSGPRSDGSARNVSAEPSTSAPMAPISEPPVGDSCSAGPATEASGSRGAGPTPNPSVLASSHERMAVHASVDTTSAEPAAEATAGDLLPDPELVTVPAPSEELFASDGDQQDEHPDSTTGARPARTTTLHAGSPTHIEPHAEGDTGEADPDVDVTDGGARQQQAPEPGNAGEGSPDPGQVALRQAGEQLAPDLADLVEHPEPRSAHETAVLTDPRGQGGAGMDGGDGAGEGADGDGADGDGADGDGADGDGVNVVLPSPLQQAVKSSSVALGKAQETLASARNNLDPGGATDEAAKVFTNDLDIVAELLLTLRRKCDELAVNPNG
jgi:hypothetical protein